MTECQAYKQIREQLLRGTTYEEIYSNPDETIIYFIKECGLYKNI